MDYSSDLYERNKILNKPQLNYFHGSTSICLKQSCLGLTNGTQTIKHYGCVHTNAIPYFLPNVHANESYCSLTNKANGLTL